MANLTSALAAKQELAVTRGPLGPSGPEAHRPLYCYQETITITAPGSTTVDRLRFCALPAGAQVVAHLCFLSTSGSSVAGKVVFTPLDGSAATEVTGQTIGADTGSGRILPPNGETVLAKESYFDFVPSSPPSVGIGTSFRARIVYALTH
jgi:hypothetical protein